MAAAVTDAKPWMRGEVVRGRTAARAIREQVAGLLQPGGYFRGADGDEDAGQHDAVLDGDGVDPEVGLAHPHGDAWPCAAAVRSSFQPSKRRGRQQ